MKVRRTKDEIESDIKSHSKVCLKCNERKDFHKFNKKSQFPDGYYSICRSCDCRKSVNRRTAHELQEELVNNKKTCCVCKEVKSRDDFWNTKRTKDGKTYECKSCGGARRCKYEADKKDKIQTTKRLSQIKTYYNSSEEVIVGMMNQQKGCCCVCGDTLQDPCSGKNYAIDHNHNTGEIRGLLCLHCNSMLGQAKDSPSILLAGYNYLIKNGYYGTT